MTQTNGIFNVIKLVEKGIDYIGPYIIVIGLILMIIGALIG